MSEIFISKNRNVEEPVRVSIDKGDTIKIRQFYLKNCSLEEAEELILNSLKKNGIHEVSE